MHGCTCGAGARRAPAALWCRVQRAYSARAEDAVVTGLARRGVREHRRDAGEPRCEHCAMYMCTIESAPFTRVFRAARPTGRLQVADLNEE
eukprot:4518762-Prymnesium_polylepis.1